MNNKKLTLEIVVGVLVFLAVWFLIKVMGEFLSIFLVQGALSAVITWAVISVGDRMGLFGFAAKKPAKKRKK